VTENPDASAGVVRSECAKGRETKSDRERDKRERNRGPAQKKTQGILPKGRKQAAEAANQGKIGTGKGWALKRRGMARKQKKNSKREGEGGVLPLLKWPT